jgi:hypothetical protein
MADETAGGAQGHPTAAAAFIEIHNKNPKSYRWTKSEDEILTSVKRFCQKTERTLCNEF